MPLQVGLEPCRLREAFSIQTVLPDDEGIAVNDSTEPTTPADALAPPSPALGTPPPAPDAAPEVTVEQPSASADDTPTAPTSPWLSTTEPTSPPPPAPPAPRVGAVAPSRDRGPGPGWRQFVVGAVVGALVGGGTAAGVAVATRNDNSGNGRTVVVRSAAQPVRESSTIGSTKNIQTVLTKLDGAVVAVQTGDAVDSGLFDSGSGSGSGTGGAGTGFVIDSSGVIVTNNHVVDGAGGRIEVVFGDGTRLKAELLGQSAQYDLAVLKVDAHNLPTLKLGSSDALQVGDEVVAVGNALALDGSNLSVTKGIISGKGRVVPEDETGNTLYDMLQTDAAINPGNSGGPLVDAEGQVIGINTALAGGSQNVGFAISIDSVKSVIQDLRDGKSVKVPFLGVESGDVTPAVVRSLNLKTKNGAVVRRVTKDTGAEKAGLKPNDVIVAIDGRTISGPQDVGAAIRRSSPGDIITVTVERDGSQQDLKVTLGTRPDSLG